MSELRDTIADILRDHHSEEFPEPEVTNDSADAILAAFAAAMTSREVVAALTKRIVEVSNERCGFEDDTWPDDYNEVHVVAMMNESQEGITAALRAAGVKGEGE